MTDQADENAPEETQFARRGWLLLGGVVLAFGVVPLVIYLRPPSLPFFVAYLVLPLVPAVALAALAVWTAAGR